MTFQIEPGRYWRVDYPEELHQRLYRLFTAMEADFDSPNGQLNRCELINSVLSVAENRHWHLHRQGQRGVCVDAITGLEISGRPRRRPEN